MIQVIENPLHSAYQESVEGQSGEGGEMKMGFFCSGVVWGFFFILLGISILLKHVLHVDIPVIPIFFAAFLIYLGVNIIVGGFNKNFSCGQSVVFGHGKMDFTAKGGKYDVIFSKGEVDLTGVEVKDKDVTLETNTVFGSSVVKIKSSVPTLVRATAAFGAAHLPDGNTASFGEYVYKNKAFNESKPSLNLKVTSVFGEVR